MSTPIYDELEEKWNAVGTDRRICDKYMRCFLIETGAEWYEDDEGNEVLPGMSPTLEELNEGADLYAYFVPNEVKVGDTVSAISLGGIIPYPELDKPSPTLPKGIKPKFKLFGRNQGTNGTL